MRRKPLSKSHKDYIRNAAAHVEECEQKRFAVQWAVQSMDRYNRAPDEVQNAANIITGWLYQMQTLAYRDMFMLAMFTDEEDQAAVKDIVIERFVKGRMDLERYFPDRGWTPEGIADELEFAAKTAEIKKRMKEGNDDGDPSGHQ